jgi:hypothetical protein
MPPVAELQISFAERKLLRWLFLFYCLFILYGSFIPFRFSDDPEFVRSQFVRFFTLPYHHGVRKFSVPDVLSNILLFFPFVLWVGGNLYARASIMERLWRSFGTLCALTIESGQMFSGPILFALMQRIRFSICTAADTSYFELMAAWLDSVATITTASSLVPWPCFCSQP